MRTKEDGDREVSRTRRPTGPPTEDQKDLAIRLYQDNVLNRPEPTMTTDDIYQRTGVSRPALYLLLQREGITPRSRRKSVPPEVDPRQLMERNARLTREVERLRAHVNQLEAELEFVKFGGPDGEQ